MSPTLCKAMLCWKSVSSIVCRAPELAWELTVVQTRAIEMRMLTGRRPVMAFSNGAGEKNVLC